MDNILKSSRENNIDHWKYLFELIVENDDYEDYISRYYVNSENTQIKRSDCIDETIIYEYIITCPVRLDHIICSYLCKQWLISLPLVLIVIMD